MPVYRVHDTHGGGYLKFGAPEAYVVARDEDEADELFHDATGYSLHAQSCPCCGPNFTIDEFDTEDMETPREMPVLFIAAHGGGLVDSRLDFLALFA